MPEDFKKLKPKSNTGETKRVETACGLRMTYEESLLHDCFHCRQARSQANEDNYDRGSDVEDVVNQWRKGDIPS